MNEKHYSDFNASSSELSAFVFGLVRPDELLPDDIVAHDDLFVFLQAGHCFGDPGMPRSLHVHRVERSDASVSVVCAVGQWSNDRKIEIVSMERIEFRSDETVPIFRWLCDLEPEGVA